MGLGDYKPTIIMIACQFLYSGVTLTGRAALMQNMSSRVFVVYRQSIAFLLIAPLAFFTSVTVNQNIFFEGLYLASSSAASALGNLVPAITFIMAYTLGLEKVHLRSLRSVAKIIGTLFCVSGAVVMALLKGPKLLNMEFQPTNSLFIQGGGDTWLLGCLFLFGSTCCWSIWLILQAHVGANYDNPLSLTAWMCLIAAIQSGIVTFIFEPNLKAWKMDTTLEISSCFLARGPLFSAMFNPLSTVIVTVIACIFLHEELYIGSLMGALAVVIGLYIVLWGKAKDHEEIEEETSQMKKQNDQFSDNISCKIDLEEPLLSEKSANLVEVYN
ncbi:hypothetical protein BUALT_Bualt16G0097000 [Buddleja alternifolia]|uniref:WAT1-related protein n=1 Tax=Buddleja alternifolia TaxID=168488 RepID=A0AAV6WIM9_9LAMI|nr:hypothetical protein BUALT_Bualt16G0097000 [Buddleja alternifolia]